MMRPRAACGTSRGRGRRTARLGITVIASGMIPTPMKGRAVVPDIDIHLRARGACALAISGIDIVMRHIYAAYNSTTVRTVPCNTIGMTERGYTELTRRPAIGRATRRERVCLYVKISVAAVSLSKHYIDSDYMNICLLICIYYLLL